MGGAKLYRASELRWTDHEVTEIVILEAMVAMHHATSAQVQNAGIWRTYAFPAGRANYVCSENSSLKSKNLVFGLTWKLGLSYADFSRV